MKNFFKKHLLFEYIVVNLLFILTTCFLYFSKVNTYEDNSKLYIIFLALNVIAILIHIIKTRIKKEKIRFTKFDLFLIIIFGFSLLSSVLSIDTESAFFGFRYRYEGFLQIMYYFSLFLLASFLNKEEKKKMAYFIVGIGVVETLYAHFQKYDLFNAVAIYFRGTKWISGLATNPNFFGSLVVLELSVAIGLFFDSKNNKGKVIGLILVALFMSGLLLSNTLSAFVGLIVVLIYLLIYSIIKKEKLKLFIIVLILSIITVIHICLGSTTLIKDLVKTTNESTNIIKGNIDDDYGTHRMYIWKESIKVVPKNLTYGVGIDNFYYAFGDEPLIYGRNTFDKAHNEYLQILVCEGIYALAAYLLFFGVIVLSGIKNSFKNKELYLIIPVIAYLVQAFFNISVIEVAPFFYAYLGLCSNREKN